MNLDSLEPKQITDGQLLAFWGRDGHWNNPRKSLELLTIGYRQSAEDLCGQSLGSWNRALLRLRITHYGPKLHLTDKCPDCRESVEFETDGNTMLEGIDQEPGVQQRMLDQDGWKLTHRLLTGGDLIRAMNRKAKDSEEAGKALLGDAVLSVEYEGKTASPGDMSQSLWELLAASLSEADPSSEFVFDLKCPECGHRWESLFDPGDYLWKELSAASRRLFYQVHTIAVAYGWTEDTIVALSPERRSAYTAVIEELNGGLLPDISATHLQRNQGASL